MTHYEEEEDWMRIGQPESRKRVQNRLSQRRHRAKFRAQNSSAAEVDLAPSSASSTLQGVPHVAPDNHFNPSIPFTRLDNSGGSSQMLTQSHDDTDNLVGFDVQQLLPSDYNSPNLLSPQPQLGWSTLSYPTTSQSPASSRIAPGASLQNGAGFFTAGQPASCPLPENSANTWNGRPSSDPQWTVPGINHNSMHTESFRNGSSVHPGGNLRSRSHHHHGLRPTTISTNFVEHDAPLQPAPRGNEMCPSSHEQYQRSPDARYQHLSRSQSANSHTERPTRSGHASLLNSPLDRTPNYSSSQSSCQSASGFGPASPIITDTLLPLQNSTTHCQHCHCVPHPRSPLAPPSVTPPHNLDTGPSRPTTHTPSSRNLEILSECSQALRNLVHGPEANDLVDKRQSGNGDSSRESGRRSLAVYTPCSERSSADEGDDGKLERRKGVEKVVIVYVNGKFEGIEG